jgi:hypothetical protein
MTPVRRGSAQDGNDGVALDPAPAPPAREFSPTRSVAATDAGAHTGS